MNVTLLGRLGADPESKATDRNGNKIVNFSLAETNSRKQTNWWQCTIFGKQAELVYRTVQKGDQLLVEGNLDYETYTKDGDLRTVVKLTVRNFTYVEAKRDSAATVDPTPAIA